jgi:ABC-type sugar transport system permease subunit/ABC-type glycerol-3-phosphate transport system substrate-binding protein
VPFSYYSMALVCDNAAFARRGLAGRYPRDWDELYQFARHLTFDPRKELGSNPNDPLTYGLAVATGLYAGWIYLQFVWSAGGDVVQPYYPKDGELHRVPPPPLDYRQMHIGLSNERDYLARLTGYQEDLRSRGLPTDYSISDLKWRLETDKPDAIQALYYYRKLAHQPWLRNGDHEFDLTPAMFVARRAVDPVTGDAFNLDDPAVKRRIYYGVCSAADVQSSGVLSGNWVDAMYIGTLGEAESANPNVSTFVPFPSRKGFLPAAFIAGHYLGVNAAIAPENVPGRHDGEAIREAAWTFVEFETGPAAQRIMIDTFVECGLTEFIRPALLEGAGYGDLAARLPAERRQLWENLGRYARVEPYSQGFTHVMTRELGMAIEAAFSDRPDPATGAYRRDLQAVMSGVVRNVNTMILDKMPEEMVRRRARIGWILFAVMIGGLAAGLRLIVRLATRAEAKLRDTEGFGVGGNPAARQLYAWMFLIPAVASIAIWSYYPLGRGLIMAFQDFRILGGSAYVGLRNFVEAVSEPKFWRYLLQTLQYMVMLVGIGFLIPILLAVLLSEIPRLKVLFRTVYYLPAVTTGLVTLFLWKRLLFDPTSQGVLNRLIQWFNAWPAWLAATVKIGTMGAGLAIIAGLAVQAARAHNSRRGRWAAGLAAAALLAGLLVPLISLGRDGGVAHMLGAFVQPFAFKEQGFLRDPDLALFWLIVPVIWAGAGPGCLIYLAALKGIPEEQYEAADLDGAGLWHKLVHVTYPNLKALIIINFIGAVIAGFKESGNIFVMTGGGPEDATMTTGLYIWYNAFMFLNFGLSTAMAWIMGALLIGFTLTQLRILNKLQFRNVAIDKSAAEGGG